jgi:hypothetical protein
MAEVAEPGLSDNDRKRADNQGDKYPEAEKQAQSNQGGQATLFDSPLAWRRSGKDESQDGQDNQDYNDDHSSQEKRFLGKGPRIPQDLNNVLPAE